MGDSETGGVAREPGTPRRRWLRAGVVLVLGLCGVFAVALWSGVPQREGTEGALGGVLGAEIVLRDLTVLGGVRTSSLAFFDDVHERDRGRATFEFTDLALDYEIFPEDGRHVRSLDVAEAAVFLDAADPSARNFDFITDFLSQPSSGIDPLPFLPRTVNIRKIPFEIDTPDAGLTLDGIGFAAEVRALDDVTIQVTGERVAGTGWAAATETISLASARLPVRGLSQ